MFCPMAPSSMTLEHVSLRSNQETIRMFLVKNYPCVKLCLWQRPPTTLRRPMRFSPVRNVWRLWPWRRFALCEYSLVFIIFSQHTFSVDSTDIFETFPHGVALAVIETPLCWFPWSASKTSVGLSESIR